MSFPVTWRPLLAALLAILVTAFAAACGDDEESGTGTNGETTAAETTGEDATETTEEGDSEEEGGETTAEGGEGSGDVKATVRLRRAQANSREYSTRVEGAKPGDTIIVRAEARRPEGAEGQPTSDFTIVVGPGADNSGLVVKTSAGDDTRRATVAGAGDDQPEVSEVSYRCAIPPADTFCPVEVEKKGDQYEMVVPAAQTKVPVVLYVRLKD